MNRQTLQLNDRTPKPLTVEAFLAATADALGLELVAGATGLSRVIVEPVIYRPGLALTGFLEHFAFRRPQLLGRVETAYLLTLSLEERLCRWEALLRMNVPCVILCHPDGTSLGGDLLQCADTLGVPVLTTRREALEVCSQGTLKLHELTAKAVSLHGTLMEVSGVGVLLMGRPGVGKSETALGLLRRGHALIADDQPCIALDTHGKLCGYALGCERGYIEIRGLGMLSVPHLFGALAVRDRCPLDIIVNLRLAYEGDDLDRVGLHKKTCEILGVDVPSYDIPVAAGRDFVNVVETAAAVHKMREAGVDFDALLDEQIIAHNQLVRQVKL